MAKVGRKKRMKHIEPIYLTQDDFLPGNHGAVELNIVVNELINRIASLSDTTERCEKCSTERKIANDGTRYLCNHFSEYCHECIEWVKPKKPIEETTHFDHVGKVNEKVEEKTAGWESEFDENFVLEGEHTNSLSKKMFTIWPDGTRSITLPQHLKGFISSLLSKVSASSREKGFIEGQKHAFGVDKERVARDARKEEREEMRRKIEELIKDKNYVKMDEILSLLKE